MRLRLRLTQPPAERKAQNSTHDFQTTITHTMFRTALTKTALAAVPRAASRATLRPVLARAYHEKVISHYENPRNVCSL